MRQGDMETEMDLETLIGGILCSLLMMIKMRLVSGVDVIVDKPVATFVVGYLLLSLWHGKKGCDLIGTSGVFSSGCSSVGFLLSDAKQGSG